MPKKYVIKTKKFNAGIFLVLIIAVTVLLFLTKPHFNNLNNNITEPAKEKTLSSEETVVPTLTITLTPTPRPLTFAELNAKYGPCVRLPVLMYHHIQSKESALKKGQTGLTVFTDIFKSQMKYLKDKNYNVITTDSLIGFFDKGQSVSPKSILLTFDDAYSDFYADAYPILKEMNFSAVVFTPTGLVNNPSYLTWNQISEMAGNMITFSNHTWSHKNVGTNTEEMKKEISIADTQLTDRGLNTQKIFAYPYGIDTNISEKYLSSIGYKAAFTTMPGNTLCLKQRFNLPRVRIGSTSLSSYGF